MKKKTIIFIFISVMLLGCNMPSVHALDKGSISEYYNVINEVNEEYNANLYILTKSEFNTASIKDNYNGNYDLYIKGIMETDIDEFKRECISTIVCDDDLEVSAYCLSRSTLARKTVSFYTARNSMTLTYKYNGSKFDPSYKPSVSVKKLSNTNYFSMSSWFGTFKNSNKTYSVTAKGKIYTISGVANNRTFTINFNL